jgi:hypothetical protein
MKKQLADVDLVALFVEEPLLVVLLDAAIL